MTLEQTERELVITWLPVEQMGLLSLGIPLSAEERSVLEALLSGGRVCMTEEALEYKKYARSAPSGIYVKFVAMERELREMGIVLLRGGKRI